MENYRYLQNQITKTERNDSIYSRAFAERGTSSTEHPCDGRLRKSRVAHRVTRTPP